MWRKKIILLVFLLLPFTFYLFTNTPVFAKDYSIKSANITVQLNRDGSADVQEKRTYSLMAGNVKSE